MGKTSRVSDNNQSGSTVSTVSRGLDAADQALLDALVNGHTMTSGSASWLNAEMYGTDEKGKKRWPDVFTKQENLLQVIFRSALAVVIEQQIEHFIEEGGDQTIAQMWGYLRNGPRIYSNDDKSVSRPIVLKHRVTEEDFAAAMGLDKSATINTLQRQYNGGTVNEIVRRLLVSDLIVTPNTIVSASELEQNNGSMTRYATEMQFYSERMRQQFLGKIDKTAVDKPVHPQDLRVKEFNERFGDIIQITDPGPKSWSRALEKSVNQGFEAITSESGEMDIRIPYITDMNRAAVHAASPELEKNFLSHLRRDYSSCNEQMCPIRIVRSKGWGIKPGGYMDHKVYVVIDHPVGGGMVLSSIAEIQCKDLAQYAAGELTTPIYQAQRLMRDDNDQLDFSNVSYAAMMDLLLQYNSIMQNFADLNKGRKGKPDYPVQFLDPAEHDYRDLDDPNEAYKDLLIQCNDNLNALHKSVHIYATLDAPLAWREHHITMAADSGLFEEELKQISKVAGKVNAILSKKSTSTAINGNGHRNGIAQPDVGPQTERLRRESSQAAHIR